jgi:iron-sulfur cluster insertion protein
MADTIEAPNRVTVSENAAKRIATLIQMEGDADLMLRLSVSGGGCSGFQYGFSFDKSQQQDDRIFERNGVKVVIDDTSLELLAGAEIDFVEDLVGASFQIKNPNASSSCGCGNSFSV